MLLSSGCARFTVCLFHLLKTPAYDSTAEDETSRRKGYLKHATPTQTTATDATSTSSPAGVSPGPTNTTSPAGVMPEPTNATSPTEEPSPTPTPKQTHHEDPLNNLVPEPQRTPSIDGGNEQQASPPRGHSLTESQAPELANNRNPATNEQDSLPDVSDRFKRSPPPPGAFTFRGPSPFLTPATIQHLQTICAGQRWTDMVNSFLRFEELPVGPGVRILILTHLLRSLLAIISPLFVFPLDIDRSRCPSG